MESLKRDKDFIARQHDPDHQADKADFSRL
jgi:hypothetical protein